MTMFDQIASYAEMDVSGWNIDKKKQQILDMTILNMCLLTITQNNLIFTKS